MSPSERIVAELGRPETPEETATRKAESSRVYRSSQTVRNLAAALIAILAVVLLIVLIVPRGSMDESAPVDVASVANEAMSSYDRAIVVPQVPDTWRANAARVTGDATPTWSIVYATGEKSGFLNIAQGFDADSAWDARLLSGATADGTVTIDGLEWTHYAIRDSERAGNVSYAIATDAGTDRILVYGATDAKTAAVAATGMTDQIEAMREETK
ncbi:DUF4245 family protein [Microbacterium protaetiae]|uniref:DUF4245 family protein n=1 Tax=Microbacterium protaetiae TaxID=2509458 RepID=A0A4P6EFA7_9MICO|nr:DUF4245 family protein [Microbacterium protaetiae]QAY60944.1 DUF4245 family protein [Microbacterium protaetiae]